MVMSYAVKQDSKIVGRKQVIEEDKRTPGLGKRTLECERGKKGRRGENEKMRK